MSISNYKEVIDSLNLTDEQKEVAYRAKQFENIVFDIEDHIDAMTDIEDITEEEGAYAFEHIEEIVEEFIKYQDHYQAENDPYESAIYDFLKNHYCLK